ncbi:MAG: MinD/ParA family protein [Deltaproteobacteria bacterium]|nr:MinD/ParA family protein [Deltaproteobacteria bacterium]
MFTEPVLSRISMVGSGLEEEGVVVPFDFGLLEVDAHVDMPPAQSKVICIASGKGGTGKTTFTVNLALALAKAGQRVLLLDADFGLANAHLLLGVTPQADFSDYINHQKSLEEILLDGPHGLKLIPGGQGVSKLSNLQGYQVEGLARDLSYLEPQFDFILMDLAAGISLQNMLLLRPAHEIVLVTNPEITACMDAYAMIKALSAWHPDRNPKNPLGIHVVMNRIRKPSEGREALDKLTNVVKKYLENINIHYYGSIPFDRYLLHSIEIQKPLVLSHPKAKITECLEGISRQVYANYVRWNNRQMGTHPCPSYFSILEKISHNYDFE